MSRPVKLIALLKAVPGGSREQFGRRWIDGHAPIALRFKNLKGYRINVAIDEYQDIEGELPYDGTAELWWDSLEKMREDFDSPEAEAAVARLFRMLLRGAGHEAGYRVHFQALVPLAPSRIPGPAMRG